jgi:RNA polymerase sigma factor (TIGR02999 family)
VPIYRRCDWLAAGLPDNAQCNAEQPGQRRLVDIRFERDLAAWRGGDQQAGDRLYGAAYPELRSVASRSLRTYGHGDQLHTTLLVNECYLKLAGSDSVAAEDRRHFLALCARAMRQIIVDSARRQLADKRGAGEWHIALDDPMLLLRADSTLGPEAIAALDQALTQLGDREPRLARIAECRIFSDLGPAEIAEVFGVTERTVQREWQRIKAMLTLVLDG